MPQFIWVRIDCCEKEILKGFRRSRTYSQYEDYQNNVGRSERTNAVVEPRLSL